VFPALSEEGDDAVGELREYLQAARGATHSEITVGRIVAECWKFKVGRRKFTDGCAVLLDCRRE
jgi:hypothetical protein